MARRHAGVILAVTLVALAGCGGVNPSPATETSLTPVAVPTDRPTTTPTSTPDASVPEPRYLRLRPTCERPPGLVVAIQVGALRNDPRGSNEGINTTWQFAAPSNRRSIGSFVRFVDVIERGYGPLLDAETVTFGPIERGNGTATRQVAVRKGNRTTAYRWKLELQPDGPLEGCWLTTSVVGIDEDGVVSLPPVDGLPRP
jgi:hypothetical protein